ncbi:MAG: helicase-associated domain-containing protein, partial [Treponema sp.]|nr:helicase-associated domain-containing protein [Treponema sp.]
MAAKAAKPLIVQSDRTLLLDIHCESAEQARSAIIPFAELEKSPEHVHTYRITPLSLWNAASAGFGPADIEKTLAAYSRYKIPSGIIESFTDTMARFGKIRMAAGSGGGLFLEIADEAVRAEVEAVKTLEKYLAKTAGGFSLRLVDRGSVKLELIRQGWPVQDDAPLAEGESLDIGLRGQTLSGRPFAPRDYQIEAARAVL